MIKKSGELIVIMGQEKVNWGALVKRIYDALEWVANRWDLRWLILFLFYLTKLKRT